MEGCSETIVVSIFSIIPIYPLYNPVQPLYPCITLYYPPPPLQRAKEKEQRWCCACLWLAGKGGMEKKMETTGMTGVIYRLYSVEVI